MIRLFKKQMNKHPNKKLRAIVLVTLVIILGVFLIFWLVSINKPFKYDSDAGKQQIEVARAKIYESSDYNSAILSLTDSEKNAAKAAKYNILIEKGSYQAQINQIDQAKDTFEQAKTIGGYSNPIVGIVLGAYYTKTNKALAKEHYLGAKASLENKPDSDPSKAAALKNVNQKLKELDDAK